MRHLKEMGFWSAILSLIFAIGYIIPQIFSTSGILPHPRDLFWLFLPSLFLAPAFVLTIICLHYVAPASLRIWTAIAWSFAVIYCSFVTLVYFVELTVVVPAQLKGATGRIDLLLFDRRTFMMAIDCLGYFFMSLSTFFAAFAFKNLRSKWLYRSLLLNGSLIPVLVLAFFYPVFYYVGALWMITFPVAMINAARLFHRLNDSSQLELKRHYQDRKNEP